METSAQYVFTGGPSSQGIYVPSCSFKEALLDNCPIYTWKGICEAYWVICRGSRWRVGDGSNINVWLHP